MKIGKRAVSGILISAVVMSMLLTGCKGEEEPPREPDKMETVPMKVENAEAKKTVNDVAVRYFYLINSGNYDEAIDLLALEKTDIMSGSILDRLYKSATNCELSSDFRIYGVDSVLSSYDKVEGYEDYTVTVQYANIKDTSFEEESSVPDGEESPPSVIVPSIDPITFASDYLIEDYDSDDYLTEKDMQEYDKEYAESQAELEEQEQMNGEVTTETAGTNGSGFKTVQLTAKDLADNEGENNDNSVDSEATSSEVIAESSEQSGVNSSPTEVSATGTDAESKQELSEYGTVKATNSVYNLKSMEIRVRRYEATPEMLKREGMYKESEDSATSSEKDSKEGVDSNNSKSSKVESKSSKSESKGSEVASNGKSSTSSEDNSGVNSEEKEYVCKIVLPDSFWNNTKVMFAIPTNAKLMLDDVTVNKQALDLDDWYVLNRVPQLSNWTLRIMTNVDSVLTRDIDLTYRVAYAYQWIQPSRSCKESALKGAKSIMQSMFTSLEKKQSFAKSDFVKKSVGMKANKSEFKSYYEAVLANKPNAKNMTVVSVTLADSGISTLSMGIYDSRYITIPVVLDYSYVSEDEVVRRTAEGVIHLTKEDDTWKLWNVSQELIDIW